MNTQTKKEQQLSAPQRGEIILYQTADGRTKIDVKLENETVWLTQDQLVILFERDRSVISRHISNIFKEGELDPNVVCAKIATTTPHGAIPGKWQTHEVVFYNLDVIISVGYRVKSQRGTQFRIWANSVLKDYLILYAPDGHKRIADNALVALTLMIAESKTDEMDMMVKVVVNLINGDNK